MAHSGVIEQVRGAAWIAQTGPISVGAGLRVAFVVAVNAVLHLRTAARTAETGIADQILVGAGSVVAGTDAGSGGAEVFLEAVFGAPATGVVVVHALRHVAGRVTETVREEIYRAA